MLFVEPDEIEIIPAGRTKCQACEGRYASWRMGTTEAPMIKRDLCGWCALYDQKTAWAHDNREELAHVGEMVLGYARRSVNKKAVIPELDDQHRLDPDAADRFFMGVVFTSRMLGSGPLGRMTKVGAAARELLDDDEPAV
jgi:hypothetical protein